MIRKTMAVVGEQFGGRSEYETARAFVVFGTLAAILLGIAGNLAFRELDIQVLAQRFDAAWDEARRIRDVVAALGRDRNNSIDFHRVRSSRNVIETVVNERIGVRSFLRYVEIRDRFGARLLFVARDAAPGGAVQLFPGDLADIAVGGPAIRVIQMPLEGSGGNPAGEVRVGVADEAVRRQLDALRRSLRLQIAVAAGAAVAVLVVGLFYVLFLIRKNRRLERSKIAAERRSYVGLLASGLAHEIRNPLNAMNMNLQMLEEELHFAQPGDTTEYHELLEGTKSEIKRLERLVNNFLQYARPADPRFEPLDLNDVLAQVARFLEADFASSNVWIELVPEPMLPTVDLDVTQFKQAVMNLLVNARQVLAGGGTIRVSTRAGARGDAVVEIADDGPGIPAEKIDKIFEVFYSSRGGGTGLGLPIAKQIVTRHGGTIEVESAPDEGATFRIRLPRRHAPVAAEPGANPTEGGS